MIYAGIDDGNSHTNIVLSTGQQISLPSRAKAGEVIQTSVMGGQKNVHTYRTSDGTYSVGNVKQNDSTQFNGYPTSTLNRAIVAHALSLAGLPENTEIACASGLPFQWYYKNGKVNNQLVKQKSANLLKNDVVPVDPDRSIPLIKKHDVTAEALSAWLDIVLVRNREGRLEIDSNLRDLSYGVIDIGGRTTDIVTIENGNIDFGRSVTVDIGLLNTKEKIGERIGLEYDHVPSELDIEKSLTTKRIKLWGKEHLIDHIIHEEMKSTLSRLESITMKTIKSSGDLDRVLFIGGSMNLFEPLVGGWFRNQEVIQDPGFANARGMAKFIEFKHQGK